MMCPRCHREVHPWPVLNGNGSRRSLCSPKTWANCIRADLEES